MKKIITIVLVLLFAACTKIPLTTMYKLSKHKLENINPEYVEVAIRMPKDVKYDDVILSFSYWHKSNKSSKKNLEVKLQQVLDDEKVKKIDKFKKSGYTVALYNISKSDVAKINSFRKEYLKQVKLKHKFEAEYEVYTTFATDTISNKKEILFSSWIKLDKDSKLLPLLQDYNIKKEIKSY